MPRFFDTVFAGGGISCLMAARELGGDALVLEREDRPGGLCRSDTVEGFTFDRTGHLLHLRDPKIAALVRRLLKGNLGSRERNSWICSHGAYTRYPFQSHFHGLPVDVIAECLLGVFKAHLKPQPAHQRWFADWVLSNFGAGVARHFMLPYNRKLWTVDPAKLTTEWLGRFVPRPALDAVIRGALADLPDPAGYNARFLYPIEGGIEALVRGLAAGLSNLRCGVAVREIHLRPRELVLSTGERLGFGRLISCLPLPALTRMIRPLPEQIRHQADRLRHSAVYNLNLGLRGKEDAGRHWVYVPEDRFGIYRFGYASNFSTQLAPPGCRNLYTELAFDPRRPPRRDRLRAKILRDLKAIGVLRSDRDILVERTFVLDPAYPVYDRNRTPAVAALRRYLEAREIYPVGRYGRWEYGSMEDAMLQGVELSNRLKSNG